MTNPSLEDFEKYCVYGQPSAKITFRIFMIPTRQDPYEEFLSIVHDAIDLTTKQLNTSAKLSHNLSEDEITDKIIMSLQSMSLPAQHDRFVGGHVDICIELFGRYMWIAEAKKINTMNNSHLIGGINQLITRYEFSDPTQCHMSLLIYCNTENTKRIMTEWASHLPINKKIDNISFCPKNPLVLNSEHTSEKSGLPIYVRHVPYSIYFNPSK
jgi:hypothetical protein